MKRKNAAGRIAVLAAAAGFLVLVPSPSEAAVGCPYGAWPYHQTKTGGCGYGQWSRGVSNGDPWFKLYGRIGDSRADGHCARVQVHTRVAFAPDSTKEFRVCGNGANGGFGFTDTDTSSSVAGSVQAWSVRLCVGTSCTAYVDYKPA